MTFLRGLNMDRALLISSLLFLALFRLRRGGDVRGAAWLALIIAVCFLRDSQRSAIVVTITGVVLASLAVFEAIAARRAGRGIARGRFLTLSVLFFFAFVGGVALNSGEMINNYTADPHKAGWAKGQQERGLSVREAVVTAGMPYGSKDLHFGHVGGVFVQADVFARFLRDRIGADFSQAWRYCIIDS